MTAVIVYHDGYGCWTGCCGHRIELQDDGGQVIESSFEFGHMWARGKQPPLPAEMREFAEDLVRQEFGEKHVADLDWDRCIIVTDKDSC